MTLTEFLLARIAEDETVARHARGIPRHPPYRLTTVVAEVVGDQFQPVPRTASIEATPRRVLAECEAKRRIVEEHGANKYRVDPCDAHDANFETIPCPTLRALALPYADHPDYDEAWRSL